MKKTLLLVLCLLLAASPLATLAMAEEAAPALEPITLTAFIDGLPNPSNWTWGQDPSSRKITELTGVTVEVSYASTTDHTELSTMLASGTDLPDFIITNAHGTLRPLMVEQGFAQSLTKLANEYDPEFWTVLPEDMEKIYMEADGDLYCIVDWFGDASKYDWQILNSRGPSSITLKKEIYEELGSPEVKTWEQYHDFLVKAHEAHPEIKHPVFDHEAQYPWSSSSLISMIARMYGAKSNYFYIGEDDKITMNFMDPTYKKALKRYNDLYRAGLINPEQFVYKEEQKKGVCRERDIISYAGYYWTVMEGMDDLTNIVYQTIDYPAPTDGVPHDEVAIHDDFFGIGGGRGVFITKDCKAPDRAIKYLTFLNSLDGQLIQRYGVEGVTWEPDEYGRPKENQAKKDAENEGFEILQRDMGVYNYNFSWVTSNTILVYGAHNTYANWPGILEDFAIETPHQKNERLYDMTYAITDADGLVLREQLFDLWVKKLASIVLSDTDEQFEAEYQGFMDDAQRLGVEDLEGYFEANLQTLRAKGL